MTEPTLEPIPAQLTYEALPPQLVSEIPTAAGRLLVLFVPEGAEYQTASTIPACMYACTHAAARQFHRV